MVRQLGLPSTHVSEYTQNNKLQLEAGEDMLTKYMRQQLQKGHHKVAITVCGLPPQSVCAAVNAQMDAFSHHMSVDMFSDSQEQTPELQPEPLSVLLAKATARKRDIRRIQRESEQEKVEEEAAEAAAQESQQLQLPKLELGEAANSPLPSAIVASVYLNLASLHSLNCARLVSRAWCCVPYQQLDATRLGALFDPIIQQCKTHYFDGFIQNSQRCKVYAEAGTADRLVAVLTQRFVISLCFCVGLCSYDK